MKKQFFFVCLGVGTIFLSVLSLLTAGQHTLHTKSKSASAPMFSVPFRSDTIPIQICNLDYDHNHYNCIMSMRTEKLDDEDSLREEHSIHYLLPHHHHQLRLSGQRCQLQETNVSGKCNQRNTLCEDFELMSIGQHLSDLKDTVMTGNIKPRMKIISSVEECGDSCNSTNFEVHESYHRFLITLY